MVSTKINSLFFGEAYLYFLAVAFLSIGLGILVLLTPYLKFSKLFAGWNSHFIFIQCFFWTTYLAIIFPGFYNHDSFSTLRETIRLTTSYWQTHLYGLISYGSLFLVPDLFALPILSVSIWLTCLFFIISTSPIQSLKKLILVSFISFLPLIPITLPLVGRDILFGSLSCLLLFLLLPFIQDPKKNISTSYCLGLLFTLILTAEIRQDGLLYYLFFPILMKMTKNENLKQKIPHAIVIGLSMIFLNLYLSSKVSAGELQRYQLTAMIHPLNAILYSSNSNISQDDIRVIEKVLDPIHLTSEYHPTAIIQIHKELDKVPVSSEDWSQFRMTYLKVVFKNFLIFLKERLEIFMITFASYGHDSYIISDEVTYPSTLFLNDIPKDQLPQTIPYFSIARRGINYLIFEFLAFRRYGLAIGITLLNPLFFYLIAFLLSKKNRETYLFFQLSSVFAIGRSLIILFMVPEPHLTYYSPLIYLPILSMIFSILSPPQPFSPRNLSE